MRRRKFLLGTAGAIGATTIGASAYTNATVTRDVDIEVTTDDAADAALQLQPGDAQGTEINEDGQLAVHGEVDGMRPTPNGEFVYGDEDDPSETNAFSITNNLEDPRDVELEIEHSMEPEQGLAFQLYDDADNLVATSDEDSSDDVQLAGLETVYVIMELETGEDDADIEATLDISASA